MHSLTLGSLDLTRGEGNGYWFETLADGVSFGSAAGRDVIVQTLLQDGAAVSRDGYDNRELSFRLVIKASDALGLAQGEAALAAEVGRRNELVWTPPDGWGPPSVFTVVMSSMSWEFDDWGEMEPSTYGRPYVLTLTCKPFANSVDLTVVEAISDGAPPPTPITAVVDDCSAIGGWTGSGAGSSFAVEVTATGGRIAAKVIPAGIQSPVPMVVNRAGSVDMSSTPYLVIDVIRTAGTVQVGSATLELDGATAIRPVASGPSPISGMTRLWFLCPVASFAAMRLYVPSGPQQAYTERSFEIDQVIRTNVPPSAATGRQQFRSLIVPGSARTEGSLQIAHDTSSLGEVLVYTNRDDGSGYQPSCFLNRTAGASRTPDSGAATGGYALLNTGTPETYDIPSASVPEGTYAAIARLKATSASYYNVTLTASLLAGTTELGSVTTTRSLNIGNSGALFELGALALPTVAVPSGSLAKVRLELTADGPVSIDDTYIANLTIGALTWVDCGTGSPTTGGSSNRLWIDTASLDVPRPAIWVGTQPDRTDAHHIEGSKVRSEMPHRFEPGDVNLFTVTSNALYAAASLSFRPAWHSNAAA